MGLAKMACEDGLPRLVSHASSIYILHYTILIYSLLKETAIVAEVWDAAISLDDGQAGRLPCSPPAPHTQRRHCLQRCSGPSSELST